MKNKTVYVPLAVDILHSAHINILKKAQKYGDVVVGLLTDKAIAEYKKLPFIDYDERFKILSGIKFVDRIVEQSSCDYSENIKRYKPDYLIHGDDWKVGIQKNLRKKVIQTLKMNNGKLIEVPYTKSISSSEIRDKIFKLEMSPDNRVSRLKRLMSAKEIVKILESHNSLTGLIIENLKVSKVNSFTEFDGMWSSSLTDSATKGKPDNSSVDFSTRLASLNAMMEVTTKLLVFDADNGGQLEHLRFLVRSLERSGASAIIMEDKIGLKKNSLFKNQKGAKQDKPELFAKKIKLICNSRKNKDFMVIARIESFILGKGLKDALKRAEIYSKAGADAILIHSKEKTPKEIFSFAKEFKKSKNFIPLVSVPSTYSKVYEKELIKNGFKVVIYENQMLRASYKSMVSTAQKILINTRAHEVDKDITSVKEILYLIKQ